MSNLTKVFHILIVDDNAQIHKDYRKILEASDLGEEGELLKREEAFFGSSAKEVASDRQMKFILDSAFQGEKGLEMVRDRLKTEHPYSVAFVDMRMPPGWDGLETTLKILQECPDIQVVICTAYSSYSWSEILSRLGSSDRLVILKKPFEPIEVFQLVYSLSMKWEFKRAMQKSLDDLREKNGLLDIASKAKSLFLANMSHEIRTPLNAILGMAELLVETNLSEDQRKFVKVFQRSGNALLFLINDILDFSKIEAGQLSLEAREFSIRHLIVDVKEVLELKARDKGLELDVEIACDLRAHRMGDSERVRQILINLVGNAIKFTEKGSVKLKVEKGPVSNGNHSCIKFSVIDTGVGIPEDHLGRIFEMFTQADSSITRRFGGTGLGLNISRRLIEMMGGEIWVESKVGEGSTFSFHLNLEIRNQDRIRQHELHAEVSDGGILSSGASSTMFTERRKSAKPSRRILVVEDEHDLLNLVEMCLKEHGFQVLVAQSGEEALETLKSEAIDLILSDIHMPGVKGLDLLSAIRVAGSDVPFVVLSSFVDEQTEKMVKRLGAFEILSKPIDEGILCQVVSEGIEARFNNDQRMSARRQIEKTLKVLLVDDSDDNRMLVLSYLKDIPCTVVEVANGHDAVDQFKESNFDLVLMDIQMPEKDGHTATREIREWERTQGVQESIIIALSAYAMKSEILQSLNSGCNAHLTKPIRKQVLLETIHEIFQFTKAA